MPPSSTRTPSRRTPSLGRRISSWPRPTSGSASRRSAFKEYIYAADLLPQNKDAQLKAGTFLLLARRFEDARARADKALKIDPKNLEAQLLRGNATFGLNDFDDAIRQVEEAIQLDPKSGRSYDVLGRMKAAKGDAAAAEKAFRQAVEIDPKSVVAQLALGQFLAGNGRQAEAESSFKDGLHARSEERAGRPDAGGVLHGDQPCARGRTLFQVARGRIRRTRRRPSRWRITT